MVHILSVVDAYTRECLAREADSSLCSARVKRVLDRLTGEHGRREAVRSDNGPEFCSRPMQNGHVESFHGRLRDEYLNANWFCNFDHVRPTLEDWRMEYNGERPNSSLGYRTTREFRQTLEGSRNMALLPSQSTTIITTDKLHL